MLKLDDWQEEILKAEGNLCICSGRQVGKSTIVSIKAAEYMANNPKKSILVISVTEDQAYEMILKILLHLNASYKKLISTGKDKPTKSQIKLKNGSMVRCKAVGQSGYGVLGLTIDLLIVDEAAYMPEAVWKAVTPMLLTTGGNIILISTPNTKEGYFYECYTDAKLGFKTFHINSEEVAEKRDEPSKSYMKEWMAKEKIRMTTLNYAQQYLAQFLEELQQLFPDDLVKECMTEKRRTLLPSGNYYLGVDVARMGGDESTFEILFKKDKYLHQVENIMITKAFLKTTTEQILELNKKYDRIKKIGIDDGGLGVAVFEQLLMEEGTRRKVEALNNASRSLDRDDTRHKKLLKEDMYFNLLGLMERREIRFLDDAEIATSLKSVIVEENPKTKDIIIYGRYTHIAEGLIRAAWVATQDKSLNLEIVY